MRLGNDRFCGRPLASYANIPCPLALRVQVPQGFDGSMDLPFLDTGPAQC